MLSRLSPFPTTCVQESANTKNSVYPASLSYDANIVSVSNPLTVLRLFEEGDTSALPKHRMGPSRVSVSSQDQAPLIKPRPHCPSPVMICGFEHRNVNPVLHLIRPHTWAVQRIVGSGATSKRPFPCACQVIFFRQRVVRREGNCDRSMGSITRHTAPHSCPASSSLSRVFVLKHASFS